MQIQLDHQNLSAKPVQTYGDVQQALIWLGFAKRVVYGGRVSSGAVAGTPFPDGWTVSSPGTGRYVVTHNLGTTKYAVTANNISATSNIASITSLNTNYFEVTFYNNTTGATWVATNTDFMFTLALQ